MAEGSALKVRVRFSKNENIKYLGHLDVMRAFQKCLKRADIKMVYSEGFNPHQKISFALPLNLGLTSRSEYMDAEIEDGQSTDEVKERLAAVCGPGFDIMSVNILRDNAKKAMAEVGYAGFSVITNDHVFTDDEIKRFLDKDEIIIIKKTKKNETELNILPLIKELYVNEDHSLFMKLKAGSVDNIKAEIVLERLYAETGLVYDRDNVKICREELYNEEGISLEVSGS